MRVCHYAELYQSIKLWIRLGITDLDDLLWLMNYYDVYGFGWNAFPTSGWSDFNGEIDEPNIFESKLDPSYQPM